MKMMKLSMEVSMLLHNVQSYSNIFMTHLIDMDDYYSIIFNNYIYVNNEFRHM